MAQQNVFLLRLRVMREMAADTDSVISAVTAELPVGFPEHISKAIFSGLSAQAAKLLRG
ncbi:MULTISPECIES: hypothetical protein [Gammaproteobacteria]|uniref:Uncharacterized protein n=2 Tax=Gammaproteobacteria TaxID=1236 RepID=A0AAX3NZP8_9GAMM|nr:MULTISPECIES: hypothetical protein [Gammaproteobacteria]MDV0844405.1 hypothetical protein [Klebsiella quasipneumoniae subsp. quasipneumoniae]WED79239.1 hypothetical protein PYU98_25135 [Aeromonas allosaccharophila]BBG91663.1 hypothetical protein ACGSH8M1_p11180 [Aeromonas caviae]BBT97454.1 hypothetical protein WP8W19C03_P11010 [Aeromonas veronii]